MIDESRNKRKEEGLAKWAMNNGIGTLVYSTGFGKTDIIIKTILKHFKKYPNSSVNVLVPNEISYKNVIDTIKSSPINKDYNVNVYTANKVLENRIDITAQILIVDEIHEFTSDERVKCINFTMGMYKHILGLTATYPKKNKAKEILDRICPIVDIVDDREAVAKGWIAPYVEYNVPIELDEKNKELYDSYTEYIRDTLNCYSLNVRDYRTLEGNILNSYELVQACFSGKRYKDPYGDWIFVEPDYYRQQLAKLKGWSRIMDMTQISCQDIDKVYNPNNIFENAKTFNKIVQKRNELINNYPKKIQVVLDIMKLLNYPKSISFSQSTSFADNLATALNLQYNDLTYEDINEDLKLPPISDPIAVSYHSQIKSKPLIDENTGEYILYKSGKRKGQPKMFGKTYFKRDAIEGIKSGKYKFISTASSLDKAVDIVDLEVAFVTGGSCDNIQDTQRKGRVKRLDFTKDVNKVKIFNIYIRDSRDEQKLLQRQEAEPSIIKTIQDLQEIE